MTRILFAGFVLGAAGSAHCAAMCGPLVMLVRRGHGVYQAGRLAMYVAGGIVTGMAGGVAISAGYARALSIVAGTVLIFGATGVLHAILPVANERVRPLQLAIRAVGRWRARHATAAAFMTGAVTGLLPCGLIYAALGVALELGDWLSAAGFMLAFWAGTLPALVVVRLSANRVRQLFPATLRRMASVLVVLAGLVLILRGVWPAHVHV
jgi:hypothetical protein